MKHPGRSRRVRGPVQNYARAPAKLKHIVRGLRAREAPSLARPYMPNICPSMGFAYRIAFTFGCGTASKV